MSNACTSATASSVLVIGNTLAYSPTVFDAHSIRSLRLEPCSAFGKSAGERVYDADCIAKKRTVDFASVGRCAGRCGRNVSMLDMADDMVLAGALYVRCWAEEVKTQ